MNSISLFKTVNMYAYSVIIRVKRECSRRSDKQKIFISFFSFFFLNSSITTEYVERQCDADGNWAIRENSTRSQYPNGWTNFTPCYTDDMKKLLDKLGNEDAAQVRLHLV